MIKIKKQRRISYIQCNSKQSILNTWMDRTVCVWIMIFYCIAKIFFSLPPTPNAVGAKSNQMFRPSLESLITAIVFFFLSWTQINDVFGIAISDFSLCAQNFTVQLVLMNDWLTKNVHVWSSARTSVRVGLLRYRMRTLRVGRVRRRVFTLETSPNQRGWWSTTSTRFIVGNQSQTLRDYFYPTALWRRVHVHVCRHSASWRPAACYVHTTRVHPTRRSY